MQAGYKQKKTQHEMTEDGKMHIIYAGEEMKIVGGKITAEKPKQEQMNKNRGKIPKMNMYRTDLPILSFLSTKKNPLMRDFNR